MKRLALAIVLLLVSVSAAGCLSGLVKRAKADNAQIQKSVQAINADVDDAQSHVAKANTSLRVAATQPNNPPQTNQLIGTAQTELAATDKPLANIKSNTTTIVVKAADAVQATGTAVDAVFAEQDHWFGYKARVALWSIGGIILLVGIGAFLLNLESGGLTLPVVGAVLGGFIKRVGSLMFHVFTFGAGKIGAKVANAVNDKAAEQDAAANPNVISLTTGRKPPA